MVNTTLEQELHEQLRHLPWEQQRQVVEFARALAATRVHGVPGHALLQFAGTIEADDVATMAQAIEDDCEQINYNAW